MRSSIRVGPSGPACRKDPGAGKGELALLAAFAICAVLFFLEMVSSALAGRLKLTTLSQLVMSVCICVLLWENRCLKHELDAAGSCTRPFLADDEEPPDPRP